MDSALFAAGVANLAATPVYAYVGSRLYERPVSAHARLPSAQFALWWWGLGGTGVVSGVEAILYSVGHLTFALALTAYLLTVLADSIILWGLVGYLLYIYTGKYHLLELTGFYAAFYISVIYWIVSNGPNGVDLASGIPTITYAHILTGPVLDFVVIGLVFPELIASILYLSLFFRTTDRTLRYRIGMVSAALFVFYGAAFFKPSTGSPELWTLVTALLDVGSAILALFAYFPPEPLQRAWGITPVPREDPGSPAGSMQT
ncbi:MAG: hypothetical protein L3K16_04280 [Thermoplasmata archaeon]|nr:hypothetical protein [Thermoplasmata archaeon]